MEKYFQLMILNAFSGLARNFYANFANWREFGTERTIEFNYEPSGEILAARHDQTGLKNTVAGRREKGWEGFSGFGGWWTGVYFCARGRARSGGGVNWRLENRQNPQAGKPALHEAHTHAGPLELGTLKRRERRAPPKLNACLPLVVRRTSLVVLC